MKKLLTATLLIFGIFALSACGGDDVDPNVDLVQEALDAIIITGKDEVRSDLTLPTGSRNNTTVVWTSDNEAIVAIDGTVVRPEVGVGNVVVTLTATITLGDVTLSTDIEVRVMEAEVSTAFTSLTELYANSTLDDFIEFEGIVVALFSGGYFLTDGTNSIGVYAQGSTVEVALGDLVNVKGTYANYYTLYQISTITSETVISSDNAYTITPTVLTVAEVLALDSTDKLVHGSFYTITGVVEARGDYGNLYLVNGTDAVLIYYYSLEDSLTALEDFIGDNVTITTVYYNKHSSNGVMLVFQGDATDVTTSALTDLELATNAAAVLDLGELGFLVDNVTLPGVIADTTATVTWATSDAAVITAAGVVTTPTGASVTATLTATVDVNGTTVTKDFVVTVVDPASLYENTVTEALTIAVGESILVKGVVSGINLTYGLFIQDADGTAIYVKSTFDGAVVVGDSIVVRGTTGIWDQHGNSQQFLESVELIEDNNGEHTIYIITDQTAAQIIAGIPGNSSQTFTADLVYTVVEDSYGYAFFSGLVVGGGDDDLAPLNNITFSVSDFIPNLAVDYSIGDTIYDVTFTVLDYNYENIRVTAVYLPVDDTPVTPAAPYSEIFFSEYIEGAGSSVNRAFEIYNPTDAAITLTGYTIDYYHNGDSLADGIYGQLDLSTYTIGAGDVLVFCNESFTAASECDEVFTYDQNNIVYTTGDDVIAIVKDGVIIDIIGVIGERPTLGWVAGTGYTMDYTIVRDPSVNVPNATWTPTEWIALAADTVSGAGSHTITPE